MIKNTDKTWKYQVVFYPHETEDDGIDLTNCFVFEADTFEEIDEAVKEEVVLADKANFRLHYVIYERME